MVQTRLENGRGMAAILGGAHHEDDIGLVSVVYTAFALNADGERRQIGKQKRDQRQCEKGDAAFERCQSDLAIVSRLGYSRRRTQLGECREALS